MPLRPRAYYSPRCGEFPRIAGIRSSAVDSARLRILQHFDATADCLAHSSPFWRSSAQSCAFFVGAAYYRRFSTRSSTLKRISANSRALFGSFLTLLGDPGRSHVSFNSVRRRSCGTLVSKRGPPTKTVVRTVPRAGVRRCSQTRRDLPPHPPRAANELAG